MLALPWPFDREFMQLALLAGGLVGASAPLIGTFLVQKRLSLLGDGIGHLAFAGVTAGVALGTSPVWTALVAAVLGAMTIELLRMRNRLPGDLVLALFFYTGIAAGVVVASGSGSLDGSVLAYLFGSILTVSSGEAWTVALVSSGVVLTMLAIGRALFALVVDEEVARVSGLPVTPINMVFSVLAAVTIVISMRVVGLLLVAALMVLPVATSQQLARSFKGVLLGSVIAGVVSVVLGLTAARTWSVAPGGSIVLAAAACFVIAYLVRCLAPARTA